MRGPTLFADRVVPFTPRAVLLPLEDFAARLAVVPRLERAWLVVGRCSERDFRSECGVSSASAAGTSTDKHPKAKTSATTQENLIQFNYLSVGLRSMRLP
jgi:hypothetical protein